MRRHLLTLLAVPALLAALVPPAAAHAAPAAARLTWGACPVSLGGIERDPRQQCASLPVPLDYRNPHGRRISVEVSRIATAKPELRRGVLLFNPGGPGGSGLDLPSELLRLLPTAVTDRFDLIGFDPRGVGYSTPVTCGISPDVPSDLPLPYPAADGSIARNVAFGRDTARSCAQLSGDLLPYITTAN